MNYRNKFRIQTGNLTISQPERERIIKILDTGNVSEGENCREFENSWANFIGTKYCTVINSGTSALIVGLIALKYKLKKESLKVATTPFTYVATINSILMTGGIPIFVDIDKDSYGINPQSLEEILKTQDVDVVMVVHLMGIPSRINEIKNICDKYNVILVEDNCQSYGTKNYDDKMLGSYGLWSACSFFIAHTLQCSELGSLNTNDKDMRRIFNKLKSNGRTSDYNPELESYYINEIEKDKRDLHPRYYHDMISGNFRTTEFSCALANGQFENIDFIITKRNENVKYLIDNLKQFSTVIQFPLYSKSYTYLGFPLMILRPDLISRKEFRKQLEDNSIETRPMFGCLPFDMPSLSKFKDEYMGKLDIAEYVGRQTFYIGCHQYLIQDDLDYIISIFKKILIPYLGK